MLHRFAALILSIGLACIPSLAQLAPLAYADASPDWSEDASIPLEGRANPFDLAPAQRAESIRAGKIHAQVYPVEITGLLPPYKPFVKIFSAEPRNPFTQILHGLSPSMPHFPNLDEVLAGIGLHPYPSASDTGVYTFPKPDAHVIPINRVGFGTIATPDGVGFTISCAACHSSNLFGKTVLGLTNRFPRANDTFVVVKKAVPLVTAQMLKKFAGATEGEARLYRRVERHIPFIDGKNPLTLGLDTSLQQVALSLAHRAQDPYAEQDPAIAANPRPDFLDHFSADSKPAVWWNAKYKTRWLSDGSVVSGNPIYTNLLWNEIGRGADLHELDSWLERNSDVVRDLTSAVFSIEAPRFTDFFPARDFDLAAAKRGEILYNARCAKCHGHYDKTWSLPNAEALPIVDQLKTWRVRYHEQTPVKDVGTDPQRWQGMKSLVVLNALAISQKNGVKIEPQEGYVPPPLVGIWARWPYFHNNSVPSLCALLTRHEYRPRTYSAVEAEDPDRDFDSSCNGYPREPQGQVREVFNTSRAGMSNAGHDEGIFLKDGREIFSPMDKIDLIRFLQTL